MQVEETPPPPIAIPPQLDADLLAAVGGNGHGVPPHGEGDGGAVPQHTGPHITAKGLQREQSKRPLVYSAPELGSESPSVQTDGDEAGSADSATAKRQQARSANPNRGSRGNRGGGRRRR